MEIYHFLINKNGAFPNNARLPILLYKRELQLPDDQPEQFIRHLFQNNNWGNTWVNGIYTYHHYHSNTHEVLGVANGECTVMLGGEHGTICKLAKGDVLILPAGVAHKNINASDDFICVGGYPFGKDFDINYGRTDEHPRVDKNIKQAPLPDADPVYGKEGTLFEYWKEKVTS